MRAARAHFCLKRQAHQISLDRYVLAEYRLLEFDRGANWPESRQLMSKLNA